MIRSCMALWCLLVLGGGTALLSAQRATAAAGGPKPPAHRQVQLVEPVGARKAAALGASRRPGKTIAIRSARPVPHSRAR